MWSIRGSLLVVRVIGASLDPQKQWLFSTQTRIEDKNGEKVRQTEIKRKQKGKRRRKFNEIQNSHTTI